MISLKGTKSLQRPGLEGIVSLVTTIALLSQKILGFRCQVAGVRRQRAENRNQMTYQLCQSEDPTNKPEHSELSSVF